LPAREGTLPEPEIYRRLLVAMGELPAGGFPILRTLAKLDRRAPKLRLLPLALRALTKLKPHLAKHAAFALRDALGPELPEGMDAAAPLWAAAHVYAQKNRAAVKRAGVQGEAADLGEALFNRLIDSPSGATISTHTYEEAWRFIRHSDGRIHLAIPELLAELRALAKEAPATDAAFPLVLVAGERRAYNANLIFRDPAWRKADPDGALLMHPDDARALGLSDGARAICESRRGSVEVRVALSDALRPGLVTLPCGYGTDAAGGADGPAVNLLTDAAHRDALTATPFHKHVPVRLRAFESKAPEV
jgi:anaerobic selenocysteine-containing dehydrogenase